MFDRKLVKYMMGVLNRLTMKSQDELYEYGFANALNHLGDYMERMNIKVHDRKGNLLISNCDIALRNSLGQQIKIELHGDKVMDLDDSNYNADFEFYLNLSNIALIGDKISELSLKMDNDIAEYPELEILENERDLTNFGQEHSKCPSLDAGRVPEFCLMASSITESLFAAGTNSKAYVSKNLWLADSGASSHMTNSESGLFNVQMIESKITIGNGKHIIAEKVGDLRLSYKEKGDTRTILLKNVKYSPQLCVNLLSIPAALSNGFNIGNDGPKLFLTKDGFNITFNQLFRTGKSSVCGIEMQPITEELANPALEAGTQLKMSKVHNILGHCGEDSTRATAKYYGWTATGVFKPCEECGIGKAKQAAVSKLLSKKSEIPGERWFIDISSVKGKSFSDSKF